MLCNEGGCPNRRAYWVTIETTGKIWLRLTFGLCADCTAYFRRACAEHGGGGSALNGDRFTLTGVSTID